MFRIIVISPLAVTRNHIPHIRSLLKENIFFHIRIKERDSVSTIDVLNFLDESDHSKIVIHQDFDLAFSHKLKGIHLSENERKIYNSLKNFPVVSTSVHSLEEFSVIRDEFEYIFYSPVFPSISKSNYRPSINFNSLKEELSHIDNKKKLIALGGISMGNIIEIVHAGFGGAAVLGSAWMSDDPVKAYSDLESAARGVVR